MIPPELLVEKLIAVVFVLEHKIWFAIGFSCPEGLTVIVNVLAVPIQLAVPFVKVGVTVIVAKIGVVPVFIAVNEGILPVPISGVNPMLVLNDQA